MSEVEILSTNWIIGRMEDNSFSLVNLDTKQGFPLTKSTMLVLAQQLDSWFRVMAEEEQSKTSGEEIKN